MSDRRPESTPPTAPEGRTDGGREDAGADAADGADAGVDDAEPNDGSVDAAGERDGARDADSDDESLDADSDHTEPLGDLARRLDARREASTGPGGDGIGPAFDELDEARADDDAGDADELFEEMDVSNVDTEALWDSVLDDADPETAEFEPQHDVAGEGGGRERAFDADAADEQRETVVPKNDHCESCHFFTDPPEAACTYEGSEIVEIVDSERFRVKNCPVVAGVVDTDGNTVGEGDRLATETSD